MDTTPTQPASPQHRSDNASADDARYAALQAHDARFDGRFFVGVSSTGVYCRPVCRVRLPKRANCRFFDHAAQAEAAGFRPCLRCRPERAPGQAPIDASDRLAWIVMQHLQAHDASGDLQDLAKRLGFSDRHLRRVFSEQFGVAPVQFVQTQRLLLAKALLTDTSLSMTDVAMAAGFGSLRRFNHLFVSRYGLNPGKLRRKALPQEQGQDHGPARANGQAGAQTAANAAVNIAAHAAAHTAAITLEFSYRPPLDWQHWLAFVRTRCIGGVEHVDDPTEAGSAPDRGHSEPPPYGGRYLRTVRWPVQADQAPPPKGPVAHPAPTQTSPPPSPHQADDTVHTQGPTTAWLSGWVSLQHAQPQASNPRPAIVATISASLLPVLPGVVAALRRLLDLDCDPGPIAQSLGSLAAQAPGVRIPGAFDGFEMAVRAILGQQVTVKAAHTLASRLVARFGQAFDHNGNMQGSTHANAHTNNAPLTHLFPTPQVLAQASLDSIASLGIVRQRAQALIHLAQAVEQQTLVLQPSPNPQVVIDQLRAIPGIGPWTAHYIALRALAWPDAWPTGDVALMKALGTRRARDADLIAERWRPWRGYATLQLWRQPEFWRHLDAPARNDQSAT